MHFQFCTFPVVPRKALSILLCVRADILYYAP